MSILVTRSAMPDFDEYCEEIRDLWDTRWLTNNGSKLKQLSTQLSAYLQSDCVQLFTNGHLALESLLKAMDLHGEVITTPFTFASTVHAIVRCGLTPVFCDIRPEDYTLNPDLLEGLITQRTCAILPVHVYGTLCDTQAIDRIAGRYHLPVIYDAAHAFGVTRGGVSAARLGYASMFSFHATKVYHTIEGGCVATQDRALCERLALEGNYGITGPEDTVLVGGNAKMNEFQAAMGLCNLRHLEGWIAERAAVSRLYDEALADCESLIIRKPQANVQSNYAYYPVYCKGGKAHRDRVFAALEKQDIHARKYFYPLITDFACYRDTFRSADTPVARQAADSILTLPLYPDLPPESAAHIAAIVREASHE